MTQPEPKPEPRKIVLPKITIGQEGAMTLGTLLTFFAVIVALLVAIGVLPFNAPVVGVDMAVGFIASKVP